MEPQTGDFVDPDSGKKVMSLKDAFSAGLIESTYLPESGQVINEQQGKAVSWSRIHFEPTILDRKKWGG